MESTRSVGGEGGSNKEAEEEKKEEGWGRRRVKMDLIQYCNMFNCNMAQEKGCWEV